MKFIDFGAFQKIMKMLSREKIIFHMLSVAFHDTPRITLSHRLPLMITYDPFLPIISPHIIGHYIVLWHIFDKNYIRQAWNQLSKMAHYYLSPTPGLEVEIYKTSNMLIMTIIVSSRCEIFQKIFMVFQSRKFKIYSGKPNSSTAI